MTVEWQKRWARVRRMSWDEIRTRLAQEVHKRLELTWYHLGISPGAELRRRPSAKKSRFFFQASELPGRVALLREHLPNAVENIVSEADAICRHEFKLLGYEKLLYGKEIDWHFDAVHGKRAPLKPWFKINFLNFADLGDHKVIWELNRHQHLVSLAKAWCLTGHAGYAEELSSQWYSWQKANPYPIGINWASSLEVAFRSLSWLWIRHLMAGCTSLPHSFATDLLEALQRNGRYIAKYLSTYFSPNTHLLGEAVVLFYLGTLCPEIASAPTWQRLGWEVVVRESERQVRADGVYFEQALYYHVYALDFFLHTRILAGLNGVRVPSEFDLITGKMLRVLSALSECGVPAGFGDDDGGRVFNPRRNRADDMADPLAIGAVLYDSSEYRGQLTEEAIWLFGEAAVVKLTPEPVRAAGQSQAFEHGGIYIMRDANPCAQQMMIDGGPQGVGHSGHGHADALSISFSVDGQRLLIDPGTHVYMSDDDERDHFRGTQAHNTLAVDSADQAIPAGPFAWTSIPQVKAERWIAGKSFDFFMGSHDGYRRLPDPVTHRRIVFHAQGGFWFVFDTVDGNAEHLIERSWHLAPEAEVVQENGTVIATVASSRDSQHPPGIALLSPQDSGWMTQLISSYVSPVYGCKIVAPAVCQSARIKLPGQIATLIIPLAKASNVGTFAELQEAGSNLRPYRYDSRSETHYIFLARESGMWSCGPWSSDAELLYCRLQDDRLTQLVMISGSFAKWQHKDLIRLREAVDHIEWIGGNVCGCSSAEIEHTPEISFEFLHPVV